MGLNANNIKSPGGNKTAQPILAPMNYPARIVQVIDLGLQARQPWQGKEKTPVNQIWVTYELPTEFMLDKDGNAQEDKPRWLSEKINMFNMDVENALSTKRMKSIDPANNLGGDWSRTLDMPVTLTVTNREYKGKTYENVGGVSAPMKGLTIDPLKNPARFFDLDDPDLDIFNDLPTFLQDMIKENLNFKGSDLEKMLSGAAPTPKQDAPAPDEDDDAPY